ncbi:MAG: ATP synthase subunit b, sodium ion specific [candidate division WS6 bacterium OLB20]|uniref:ATP synthase subunit b n=1 Tax=candidate division WS6 bacterium OLB20 TaxID=1617426 RepID=A0A136M0Y8_9BACT|nr:MAG: ATP synthase subunit b, sodium ion specific [candidate division WS6 bacterium OLB20]
MDIQEVFGKIGFDGRMFLFNVINFLVVLILLRKFFFNKLMEALDARQAKINEGLEDAERYRHEVTMAQQRSDEIISDARTEANTIVLKAQEEARTGAEVILSDAREQVEAERAKAEEQIELSRRKMIADLKKETADLAILATEKIIKEKLDSKRDREIIDEYLSQLDSK